MPKENQKRVKWRGLVLVVALVVLNYYFLADARRKDEIQKAPDQLIGLDAYTVHMPTYTPPGYTLKYLYPEVTDLHFEYAKGFLGILGSRSAYQYAISSLEYEKAGPFDTSTSCGYVSNYERYRYHGKKQDLHCTYAFTTPRGMIVYKNNGSYFIYVGRMRMTFDQFENFMSTDELGTLIDSLEHSSKTAIPYKPRSVFGL